MRKIITVGGTASIALGAVAALLAQSASGTLELISVSSAEVQGNNDSGTTGFTTPSNDRVGISADGRFVAFMSFADNLVPGDTNQVADIFVRDRLNGTTARVSVSSRGREGDAHSGLVGATGADISGDGRFVVFSSDSSTFTRGDTNANSDVFLHDRSTGVTQLVSRQLDGSPATGDSPVISDNGQFIAFASRGTNMIPDQPEFEFSPHIYVFDVQAQTITRADVDSNGVSGNDFAFNPEISADGRYIAFSTFADNLIIGPGDGGVDVFVRDRVNGTTEGISTVGDSGTFEGHSYLASISPDGRFVGFTSDDSTWTVPDRNPSQDAFVFDRSSGTVRIVSLGARNAAGDDQSESPLVSNDGTSVIFSSRASNFVAGDTNQVYDVFRRNLVAGTTERLAADDNGFPVIASDISPDGQIVTLLTRADLEPETDIGFFGFDVYTLDLRTAADLTLAKTDSPDPVAVHANLTYSISVQNLGQGAADGVSVTDELSADAVFVSATASQGLCTRAGGGSRDGIITCALGTMTAFSTATVTIVVSPSRAGTTLTNTATVRANTPDPNTANNSATTTTSVAK